jgi:outer membrane receptor protein involved in Fe transport
MNPKTRSLTWISVLLVCAAGLPGSLFAQTAPPASNTPPTAPTTDTSDANGPITELARMTVSEVPLDQQVLPTVRPISSILGDNMSIIDTPRSVSSVNQAWMDDRQVKNAMDFGQFSPGVYSAAQYGIPAVPFIRGDLAQMYFNGQIIPFSRNSTPPSFNGVEALDIIKGPGSAVYGPQGEGAGGYVNFVTKQPYFDRQHADISTTMGYWTSGHSYANPEATIDFGGPLSDQLAYRVSYLSRYGDNYYLNSKNETQDVYAAITYRATKNLTLQWWAQLYSDRTNEITGTNRVTQNFIDHGTYIGGPASPTTTGPNAYFGYDIFLTPTPPAGSFPFTADGSYSTVNQATAYNVKLPAYDALVGPEDTARAKLFQTQLIATALLGGDAKIVNLTYLANGNSNKFETYGYDEFVPLQQSIQDRIEYHKPFSLGSMGNSLIAGLDFRYQRLVSYQDFATEPFSYYDLYTNLSNVFYPGYYNEGKTWGGGLQIPGAPGYSAYEFTSGNQYSHIYDSAAFVQDSLKLTKQLSLIGGVREDYLEADTASPSLVQYGYYDAYFDFLPNASPIYLPKGYFFNVNDSKVDPSFFGSLVYKATDTRSFYATYNHVESILGSANFGGLNVNPGDADPKAALRNSLSTKSTLYELGYKESFLNNTFYVSAALFQQIKLGSEITGATYPIKDNGVELDAVYQPSRALTMNANFTFQDATAFGSGFFQETGNYLDSYPTTMIVDGQPGTGVGSPNFQTYSPPTGRMRAPGIPQVQANFFVQYTFANGFGIGAGPQIIGRQYANDQDTLHIPGEYELDGYAFYKYKRWDVRLNVHNILDERLLDPIDVSFAGNDTVYVRPPISASITIRYHL